MKETDLYPPVKRFLEGQGYEVKGEVVGCDVVGVRADEDPLVVELKLSLNLPVLLQAVERLLITPRVYVGVPKTNRLLRTRSKSIVKLMRKLDVGLLAIDPGASAGRGPSVHVIVDPGAQRARHSRARRQRLLGEFAKRVGDPNPGGSDRRSGLITAYRQRTLRVARYLELHGPTKASIVSGALDEPKARAILYRDVYGWFDRPARGIYALSPRGERELETFSES